MCCPIKLYSITTRFYFYLRELDMVPDNFMDRIKERTSIRAVDRVDIYPVRRQVPASLPLVILPSVRQRLIVTSPSYPFLSPFYSPVGERLVIKSLSVQISDMLGKGVAISGPEVVVRTGNVRLGGVGSVRVVGLSVSR